jgi:predicted SnoaL-like aldol condensation-catalyzing enzyme
LRQQEEKQMSEENKKAAIAYFEKALNEFDAAGAAALYGGKTYTQHNPLIRDGWEGLNEFIAWIRSNFPQSRLQLKHAYADGDFVVLHSHWIRVPGERGEAVVDIVRFDHGKIVEHWDVIQPIPETTANQNTMF